MKNPLTKRFLLLAVTAFLISCGPASSTSSSQEPSQSSSASISSAEPTSQTSIDASSESDPVSESSAESSVDSSVESSEEIVSSQSSEEVSSMTSEEYSSEKNSSESSEEVSSEESSSSQQSSGSIYTIPGLDKSPWASLNLSSFGATFRDSLAKLIVATGSKTSSYSGLNNVLKNSDANPDTGSVVPFYRPINHPSGTWNKEHVWPDSRGAGKSGPGSDPQMIRPTLTSDNSSRGNNFYGLTGEKTWDPATFDYAPARGEAARIIFYTATRYGKSHGLSLSNNPNDATSAKTMGVLRNLVQWNKEYPVTKMEKLRNDRLDDEGYARNPFIDFPELVDFIWDENGLLTSSPTGEGSGEVPSNRYELIKTMDGISNGMKVVIAAEAADSAGSWASLNPEIYRDYYLTADVGQRDGDYFFSQGSATEWTITFANGNYKITSGDKVLAVEVNDTHYNLIARKGVTTNAEWTPVTMNASGKLSLKNAGTGKYMEYFKGDFTCYGTDNGVYLFKK